MNSQTHNEQLLYNDLQEARKVIEKLTKEANHTSLEDHQEDSGTSGGSNILENDGDEKAEDTSLVWDNHQSFLFDQQSENYHSTPKLSEPLCNNDLESNQKHYENTNEISGLENTRN